MIPNMLYNIEPLQVCYKCERFNLKEYPNYNNVIYQNTNINEIVTIDCSLCASLETHPKFYDETSILRLINNLNKNEQLLYICSNNIIPDIIKQNFEFAGFDISDDTFSTSLLTNTIGHLLNKIVGDKELTKYGLINNEKTAKSTCEFIINECNSIVHCESPKILSVYRAIS